MKDYYYILGIRRQADLKEIQSAYHKLSIKFHPEQNGKDPFYTNYYRRIKEAYTELIDEQRRYRYDKNLERFEANNKKKSISPPPVIAAFFASKKASHIDDLITISWEVLNAETIHIDPIGQVASNGTQTVRLQEHLAMAESICLELKASNSDEANTVSKVLEIKNLSYTPSRKTRPQPRFKEEEDIVEQELIPQETATKSRKKVKKQPQSSNNTRAQKSSSRNQISAYLLVFAMVLVMTIMFYIIYSLNPIF